MNNHREIIITLDAMGGDLGISTVVEGAYLASQKLSNIKYLFFGDEKQILPLLKEKKISNISDLIHTSQIITNDIKPTLALKKFRDSSMYKAIESVKFKKSNALVSGGNTGALMVISSVIMRTINGINRPAIASMFPTKKSKTVMLDLGANIDCDVKNILDFAIMGNVFSKTSWPIASKRERNS